MKSNWQISLCALLLFLNTAGAAQPQLKLNHSGPAASVELSGDAGAQYVIESAFGSAEFWTPVASFTLSDPSRIWTDAGAEIGNRFFRARSKAAGEVDWANNFRLIDHNGVSRELFYNMGVESLKAIVITFARGDYSGFAPKIAQLKAAHPTGVLFATIDTDMESTRSNIVKRAAAAGISWPVLHDPMQLVTHEYGAHYNGEVVVISPMDMSIAYRGVIDEGTVNYARQAVESLKAGTALATTRYQPSQNPFAIISPQIVNYADHIAPLLQNKCVSCHSPGNVAPFAMTSHAEVLEHSDEIKHAVLDGHMPPWHADPEFGKFANDNSLTPLEKAQLIDWIHAGSPRGAGADPLLNVPPPPPEWPVELGPPDQIVTIPVQQIPATGLVDYRYIYANATNTTDRWLKAAVIRPGNRRVVHHYIIWEGHSSSAQLSGIAGYVPGRIPAGFPEGTGVLLKANSPLTFNLHYTASGEEETDQPQLGLWYAPTPPAKPLKTMGAGNAAFFLGASSIPAGASDFEMTANAFAINNQFTFGTPVFNVPVRVYSFSPHMHVRGSRMRFELQMPGSTTRQTLLSVPHYDFMWQTVYTLQTPLDLPAGARIFVTAGYDNSAQNHHNPDPNSPVFWGEQSWEEMFIGYIEYSER